VSRLILDVDLASKKKPGLAGVFFACKKVFGEITGKCLLTIKPLLLLMVVIKPMFFS